MESIARGHIATNGIGGYLIAGVKAAGKTLHRMDFVDTYYATRESETS